MYLEDLKIRLPNQLVILKPVSFANLRALETLLEEIQAIWLQADAALADLLLGENGAIAVDLAQKIVNLHKRIDEPGKMGFDITPLLDDLPQFEELFFAERGEDDTLSALKGGKITQVNRFNPIGKYQRAVKLLTDRAEAKQQEQPSPVAEILPVTS